MTTLNIYLNFLGNCEEAFDFYKSVFGGEFTRVARFSDMPSDGDIGVPAEYGNKIMHISLPIGDTVLLGSDIGGEWAPHFKQGNNFSISISVDSQEEADKIFPKLSEGGHVTMPLQIAFWGAYFGMLTDKFGINWMINCEMRQQG